MTGAVLAAEWIKVHTIRVHRVLVGVAFAFPVLVAVLVAVFTPEPRVVFGSEVIDLISGTSVVSLLLLACLWAINLTAEYAHGTIRVTYAAVPSRWRVVAAKAAIGSLVTAAVVAVTFWVAWWVSTAVLSSRGSSASLDQVRDIWATFAALIALSVVVSWFALGLGLIIRNSPATVVVTLLWPLLIENLVSLAFTLAGVDEAQRWMPYQAAITAVVDDGGGDSLGRPWGPLYFAAVAAVLVGVGMVLENRRDA
ncbi:MAG: hypothetical protein ACO3U0_00755 [Ilumatobacteraceae bacterium]